MRRLVPILALSLVGCSDWHDHLSPPLDAGGADAASHEGGGPGEHDAALDGGDGPRDAGLELDATLDAAADAGLDAGVDAEVDSGDAGSCRTVLLTGGTDVVAQGWAVITQQPATVSNGADYVQLQTSTNMGARSSGQLLLTRADVVQPGVPFKLEFVLQVVAVNAHNTLDSAAAIMGSLTGQTGNQNERSEMIYLDSAQVGWSDDTESAAFANIDGAKHTYVLSVDAQNTAHVSIDGSELLTRANFTSNGTIALGDQTNDANVDGTLRVYSVTKLCP